MTIHTHTQAGGHPDNEDAFRTGIHPDDAGCVICVLADGQGGRPGGARAAKMACDLVMRAAIDVPPSSLGLPSAWVNLLTIADGLIAKDEEAGFTTVVALCVYRGYVIGAANGDSAAMLLTDTRATDLTSQQSKNPPIGSGGAMVTAFSAALDPEARLLVMSDGVWKYVGPTRITAESRKHRGDALVQALLTAAKLPGSGGLQDDFTLVVMEP